MRRLHVFNAKPNEIKIFNGVGNSPYTLFTEYPTITVLDDFQSDLPVKLAVGSIDVEGHLNGQDPGLFNDGNIDQGLLYEKSDNPIYSPTVVFEKQTINKCKVTWGHYAEKYTLQVADVWHGQYTDVEATNTVEDGLVVFQEFEPVEAGAARIRIDGIEKDTRAILSEFAIFATQAQRIERYRRDSDFLIFNETGFLGIKNVSGRVLTGYILG